MIHLVSLNIVIKLLKKLFEKIDPNDEHQFSAKNSQTLALIVPAKKTLKLIEIDLVCMQPKIEESSAKMT